MGHRLSKIYTRTGDLGNTGLGDNSRIEKNHTRMEAIGDIDELNCNIGVLLSEKLDPLTKDLLATLQHALFDLGGELSIPGGKLVKEELVGVLEAEIDRLNESLPPLKEFILPRGDRRATYSHVCRAICRRAERRLVGLNKESQDLNPTSLKIINRLSDYFFVLARFLNSNSSQEEIMWKR